MKYHPSTQQQNIQNAVFQVSHFNISLVFVLDIINLFTTRIPCGRPQHAVLSHKVDTVDKP